MRIAIFAMVVLATIVSLASAQCGPGVGPYTEDFETATVGQPGTYPTGWIDAGGTHRWNVHSGSTTTNETGPIVDAIGGTNYIYFETDAPAAQGEDAVVQTPCYDASGLTVPAVEFWIHSFGATFSALELLQDDGQGVYSVIWSHNMNSGTLWQYAQVPVTLPVGHTTTNFQFRAVRGAGDTGDVALDGITFGELSAPLPEFQQNNPIASLDVNGVTVGGPNGPKAVVIEFTNVTFTLNVATSTPGSFGDIAVSTEAVVSASNGGAWYPGGNVVNLDVLASFASWNGGSNMMNLAPMNPFALPLSSSTEVTRSAQMTMVDPASPDGFIMSQAAEINVLDMVPISLSDDSFHTQTLGFTASFFGTGYSEAHVGSNGQVTFATGSPGWGFDPNSFHTSEPTIAEFATDLNPGNGGNIGVGTNGTSTFQVLFDSVPEFGGSATNTWVTTFVEGASVSIDYGAVNSTNNAMVGLSPGGGVGTLLPVDLSAGPAAFTSPGTDVPYEQFGIGTLFDLSFSSVVFTLDASGNPTGIQ